MKDLQTPIPTDTWVKVVNLNEYPPPDLAIKLGDTSISDDLNRKKQSYRLTSTC